MDKIQEPFAQYKLERLFPSTRGGGRRDERREFHRVGACESRSSHLEVFLGKGVLKICSKFTGEHPYRSAISIKLQRNFIEITLRHGCSPVNLLNIFRTLFTKNTSERLLL